MTGPYGEAWEAYRQAGWNGALPLPARSKAHPPTGYTGEAGAWPSYADNHAWGDGPETRGNICLRLPQHVLGIDVDNYDGKTGGQTVADAEARWGALPATWRTTSRDDGTSGIRLYRIPEGLHWPGKLGAATELIQHRHRYAVVWPSVHPEGRTYRWIAPEGVTSTAIPDPDALPLLPQAWIDGLTGGQEHHDTPRNDWGGERVRGWLMSRPGATGPPCSRSHRAQTQTCAELARVGESAHEAMTGGVMRAIRLADEGHTGLLTVLGAIHTAFVSNVTRTGRPGRTASAASAEAEWQRSVDGAVNKVSASPSEMSTCDCDGQLTGLIVGGAHPVAGTAALAPLDTPRPAPTRSDPQPADATDPDLAARERTSWWPRNLGAILDGRQEEPPPAQLARVDGERLFYAGKVNALLGESESGKTWIALLAVVQAMDDGQRVTYLDFEDTATGIIGRLRALGATDDQLTTLLDYIGPDETLHAVASDDLREALDQTSPSLIVLDGVNAAMTLLGLDLEKNKDATSFAQMLLRPLSAAGACVVVIDHLPKNKENRGKGGIGAQAKRAMMTGCAILVEVVEPFGRGMSGRLRLTVDKDRPGHVRAISSEAKNAGVAILTSDSGSGKVTVTIEQPSTVTTAERDQGRRSMLMEAISDHLATSPERTSLRALRQAVRGRAPEIDDALETLVRDGHVERGESRGSHTHRLVRVYSVADDLATKRTGTGERVTGDAATHTSTAGDESMTPSDRVQACPKIMDTPDLRKSDTVSRVPGVSNVTDTGKSDTRAPAGVRVSSVSRPPFRGRDAGHTPPAPAAKSETVWVDGLLIDTRTGEVLAGPGGAP